MGVACMVGHAEIAVVQVVLAVRPTARERNVFLTSSLYHLSHHACVILHPSNHKLSEIKSLECIHVVHEDSLRFN